MGIFILSLIAFVLGIILVKTDKLKDTQAMLGGAIMFISALYILTFSLFSLDNYKRFNDIKTEYNNIKTASDKYTQEDIDHINYLIKQHKQNYNNFFVGLWYSKEIGELEPIK